MEINCVLNPKDSTKEDTEKIFHNIYDNVDLCKYNKALFSESQCKKIFVADQIFNFTCYDDAVCLHFGEICTNVVKAIKNRTTFEYIAQSDQHYIDYIMVANFLDWAHIIDWGSSIRGAWFDWDNFFNSPDPEISEGVIDWICDIN